MFKKLINALKNKIKGHKFSSQSKELALELALAFLLAVVSDGIDKEELEDLEERFKSLKASLQS